MAGQISTENTLVNAQLGARTREDLECGQVARMQRVGVTLLQRTRCRAARRPHGAIIVQLHAWTPQAARSLAHMLSEWRTLAPSQAKACDGVPESGAEEMLVWGAHFKPRSSQNRTSGAGDMTQAVGQQEACVPSKKGERTRDEVEALLGGVLQGAAGDIGNGLQPRWALPLPGAQRPRRRPALHVLAVAVWAACTPAQRARS